MIASQARLTANLYNYHHGKLLEATDYILKQVKESASKGKMQLYTQVPSTAAARIVKELRDAGYRVDSFGTVPTVNLTIGW